MTCWITCTLVVTGVTINIPAVLPLPSAVLAGAREWGARQGTLGRA
jgi:hypothetical protein